MQWATQYELSFTQLLTPVSLVLLPFPLKLSIIYWPHPDVSFAHNTTGEIFKWVAPVAESAQTVLTHVTHSTTTSSPPPTAPADREMLQR